MFTPSEPRRISSLKSFSQAASVIAILVGCVVLVGWMFDITILKSILPTWVTMRANAAIAFVLSGVSLRLLRTEQASQQRRRIAQVCAGIVALMGLLTLSEYLFGWNLGIDQLLFKEPVAAVATSPPGRMAPNTALNFCLLGVALLFLSVDTRHSQWPVQLITLAAALMPMVSPKGPRLRTCEAPPPNCTFHVRPTTEL